MSKLKVGIWAHGFNYGGASTSLYYLIDALSNNREYEIHLIVPGIQSQVLYKKIEKKITKVHVVQMMQYRSASTGNHSIFRYAIARFSNISSIINICKDENLDVLHINSTVYAIHLDKIKKYISIPIVLHIREMVNINTYTGKSIKSLITNFSDYQIGISMNEIENLDLKGSNSKVIYNPAHHDEVGNCKKHLHYSKEFCVAMIAQFHPSKGHIDFLKMAHTLKNDKRFKFRIYGVDKKNRSIVKNILRFLMLKGWYKWYFYSIFHYKKLGGVVDIFGYISNIECHLKSDIDVLVRSSLSFDPWGRDIIEAMSYKIPIVAYGNRDDIVISGVNGILVKDRSYKLLAQAVSEVCKDNVTYNEYSDKADVTAKSELSCLKFNKSIIDLYKKVEGSA
jgi:glycosyltransferase involved in cell wall biosynthesis